MALEGESSPDNARSDPVDHASSIGESDGSGDEFHLEGLRPLVASIHHPLTLAGSTKKEDAPQTSDPDPGVPWFRLQHIIQVGAKV